MDRECDFCKLKIKDQIATWGLLIDLSPEGSEVVICGYCYWVEPHYFDIEDPTQWVDFNIKILGDNENVGRMDFHIPFD